MNLSNKALHKKHQAEPVSGMDKPVSWLTLLIVVALAGGAIYGGWLLWNPTEEDPPQAGKDRDLRPAPKENPEADRDFFTSFTKETEELFGPLSKAADKDSPAPKLNATTAPGAAPEGMVWVPGGEFYMGTNSAAPLLRDSRPMHLVYVDGFWMDRHELTNEEFARFVEATGYKTTAEKPPPPVEGPVPEDRKKFLTNPWSVVFKIPEKPVDASMFLPGDRLPWWEPTIGACWKHPEGPGTSIKGREKHPVVHVTWDDALAYCKWANKRLPTEAEWEFAARGGLDRKPFVWGDQKDPKGKPAANYWQGDFPNEDEKTDGFHGTAPVGSFAPNGYGLYDMAGNVWEWCSDYYQADYYHKSPYRNPKGPTIGVNPLEHNTAARVRRGGSFLCSDNYCQRFVPAARHHGEPDLAYCHAGFRCVRDPKK